MQRLWNEPLDAQRRAERETILETAVALAAAHGPRAVTMSQVAERSGLGRVVLARHFPDVQAILFAWHSRRIAGHLELLAQVRDQAGDPGERLAAVLHAYAQLHHQRVRHHRHTEHGAELNTFLHQDEQVATAREQVHTLIRDVLAEVAATGGLRADASLDELAGYCVHALGAASALPTRDALRRLVTVVLAGLRPPT